MKISTQYYLKIGYGNISEKLNVELHNLTISSTLSCTGDLSELSMQAWRQLKCSDDWLSLPPVHKNMKKHETQLRNILIYSIVCVSKFFLPIPSSLSVHCHLNLSILNLSEKCCFVTTAIMKSCFLEKSNLGRMETRETNF